MAGGLEPGHGAAEPANPASGIPAFRGPANRIARWARGASAGVLLESGRRLGIAPRRGRICGVAG